MSGFELEMNGDYQKFGRDPYSETREVLQKDAKILDDSEDKLKTTALLMEQTRDLLKDGKDNVMVQGDKLRETDLMNNELKSRIQSANRLSNELRYKEAKTKCFLFLLIV